MATPSPSGSPKSDYRQYPQQPVTSDVVQARNDVPPAYPGHGSTTLEMTPPAAAVETDNKITECHRRLSTGSDASTESTVNENLDVDSVTSSIEDRLTWRGRMQVTLHSHAFHYFIIALVVLDALIVLFELLLDLGAFRNIKCEGEGLVEQAEFCHYSALFRDKCAPPAILILEGINISSAPMPGTELGDEGLCSCQFRNGRRECLLDDEAVGVNPGLVLHGISLSILTIFMVEIGLKLIAFRLKYFLPSVHKIRDRKFYFITFEMFDGMVVVISWILDIASLEEEEAFELIDLVIILRLWRIVRVVNGAVLSAKAQLDQQLHEVKHKMRHIITALHKAQDKIDLLDRDNQVLRQRLVHETGGKPPHPPLPEIRIETGDAEGTRQE